MEPVSAMQIKEILRLRLQLGKSERETEAHTGASKGAIGDYTRLARSFGITWEAIEALSESEVWALFGKRPRSGERDTGKRTPDYLEIYLGMREKGATIRGFWEEYHEHDPATAYRETQFRQYYNAFKSTLDVRMRFEHAAGEKLWVDYAGKTVPIRSEDLTEVVFDAQIFVAVIGVSSYTYADATRSQGQEDFINSVNRACRFMNASPHVIVPDNLKAAVIKPRRHAPEINRSFLEYCQYQGSTVLPARPGKPRDKAKAEAGVLLVERWILFRLRKRKFRSLAELNQAIRELLDELNNRRLRNLPYTRREMFEQTDRPAMLPYKAGYSYGKYLKVKVDPQYHVRVDGKYYSVPFQHKGKHVWVRLSGASVEVFLNDMRLTVHHRLHGTQLYSTQIEHMPPNHAAIVEESTEKLYGWARSIGPQTLSYLEKFLAARRNAYTAHGHAKGLLTLSRTYGKERLEAACQRADVIKLYSKDSVERLLKSGRDRRREEPAELTIPQGHANVRGADYYQ